MRPKCLYTRWDVMAKVSAFCSVLLVMDSCDPSVRDAWLTGFQAAATSVVSLLTGLLTTGVNVLFTILSNQTSDNTTVTTVQAVFEWAEHWVC